MGSSSPKAMQTPYSGNSTSTQTNTYGYSSQDPTNPYVRAYQDTPVDVDPGVQRRADLAEQQMENEWNSAFNSAIPQTVRQQNIDAGRRSLRAEAADQAQAAEYQKNSLQMQKNALLLPTLTNTGGTSVGSQSGFNTQLAQPGQSPWAGILSGAASAAIPFI